MIDILLQIAHNYIAQAAFWGCMVYYGYARISAKDFSKIFRG